MKSENKLQHILVVSFISIVLTFPVISKGLDKKGRTAEELKNPYDWEKDYSGSKPSKIKKIKATPTLVAKPTPTIRKKSSEKEDLFYNRYFRKGNQSLDPEQMQHEKYQKELKQMKQHRRMIPKRSPTPALTEQQKEIKELIHMLGTEKHRRATAVERLSMIGKPAVFALRKALRHEYKQVRVGALHALRKIFSEKAIPDIERLLKDEEPEVRGEAAKTLGRMRHHESAKKVGKLLLDKSIRVRRDAVIALSRMKKSIESEQLLIATLEKNVAEIKVEAAQVLALFESPRVVEALLKVTYKEDRNLVAYAIRSLGEIADSKAKARIVVLTNNKDSFIREEAEKALNYF